MLTTTVLALIAGILMYKLLLFLKKRWRRFNKEYEKEIAHDINFNDEDYWNSDREALEKKEHKRKND